jgi:outer membrane protein TolC
VEATRPGKTQSALGLLQQAELNYHRRWISAVKLYEENLDDLKIDLAIPVTQPLMLDQGEMDRLELIDPPGTLDEALETAVVTRLDLWNARDARDDALRLVKVAEHDLLPGLDVKGAYNVKSDPKSEDLNIDGKRRDFSVGLDLDLHLDQKPSRNVLRAAQIQLQKAERDLELAQETVRKDIRASWRNLDLARKQYEIAEKGLEISEVRLERERAMFEVDRSSSRDLIDAQQALNDARDQRIAALVNHTIARLQLWKNMGILFIRKDGSWADVLARETPKGKGS